MASGVLLAFPLESVALRLAIALAIALTALRLLRRRDLRSPKARVLLALSPFVVVASVVMLASRDLALPALLRPSLDATGALSLPVADRYLDFAPAAAPVFLALWAAVVATLMGLRLIRARRHRFELLVDASLAPPRVAATVGRLARAMSVTPPTVLITDLKGGGASIVGVRDPFLVLDRRLLEALDELELEGVLAHELAHVARRDNLVAWLVAFARDVVCFVPGASSAVRALHREREGAADQDAVAVTGRPAALASGLLRAMDLAGARPRTAQGCAALVEEAGLVQRVRSLVELETPTSSSRRHHAEVLVAAAVSLLAIAAAGIVPSLLTGAAGERDALGVLVGVPLQQGSEATDPLPRPTVGRVFDVYRRSAPAATMPQGTFSLPTVRAPELFGAEDRPGSIAACAAGSNACVTVARSPSLTLRPAPIVLLEGGVSARWQATPVLERGPGEAFSVYWLARVEGPEPIAAR
jgi:beta-lactamase regulating signal transducer with metallopeptidase domain